MPMSLPTMIAAHPQVEDETEELVTAARHAMLCSLFCTSCADACVAEDMDMAQCIRNCLDCADVCAAECESHDNPHCSLCAKMCRECAEDCRKALPLVK